MTLPKDISKSNMTNAEYMALTKEERLFLAEHLGSNIWGFYSEANPKIEKPNLPCVIDGVIIGE